MEIQQFKFIYDDLKQQIKQLPHLQQLLRLAQKSTRKLQCINLYSISDKREFDLQLEEKQIMQEIIKLNQQIQQLKDSDLNSENLITEISTKISDFKNKNIETFDLLNKQDQLLLQEIEAVQRYLDEDHHDNQIKQEDQFQDENLKDSNNQTTGTTAQRVNSLKKQIDQIGMKILKINNGRGKWFQSDHNDFVKIYNKYPGNDAKIIEAGVKVLGMKNTEIMDHLEIYENYLQLQKQKKLISEQYKQIKMQEKLQEQEKKQRQIKQSQQRKKAKKQKELQENEKKRVMIQKFKEKRQEEKKKMVEQQQKKQKDKIIKIPLPPSKKKEIIERNQKYIIQRQNNFKQAQQKHEQKIPSYSASKRTSSITKLKKETTSGDIKKQ